MEAGGNTLKFLSNGKTAAGIAARQEGRYQRFCRVFPFKKEGVITFADFNLFFDGFSVVDAPFSTTSIPGVGTRCTQPVVYYH